MIGDVDQLPAVATGRRPENAAVQHPQRGRGQQVVQPKIAGVLVVEVTRVGGRVAPMAFVDATLQSGGLGAAGPGRALQRGIGGRRRVAATAQHPALLEQAAEQGAAVAPPVGHQALGLQPDLVVLNYFVGNDVTGLAVGGRVIRGTLYPTTSPQPLRHFLRKSVLFLMVETQLWLPLRHRIDPPQERIPPPDDAPIDDLYLYIASQYIPVFEREPGRRLARLWDESLAHLDRIDALLFAGPVAYGLIVLVS